MLLDNGNWLRALKRDNVHVVTDPIREITATGVVTESGASTRPTSSSTAPASRRAASSRR